MGRRQRGFRVSAAEGLREVWQWVGSVTRSQEGQHRDHPWTCDSPGDATARGRWCRRELLSWFRGGEETPTVSSDLRATPLHRHELVRGRVRARSGRRPGLHSRTPLLQMPM